MKLDYKIYGVYKRQQWMEDYKKVLPISDSDLIYDDRPNGGNAYYTCRKAWLEPVPEGVTHRFCLPDDIKLCKDFISLVQKVIEAHPDKMICLFPFDYSLYGKNVELIGSPYYQTNIATCCGVIMPVNMIEDCFSWIDEHYHDKDAIIDDEAMQDYGSCKGIKNITTIPSLVQHIGDVSLITPEAPARRTQFFIDDLENYDVDWSSQEVKWIPLSDYNKTKMIGGKRVDYRRRYIVPEKYKLRRPQ